MGTDPDFDPVQVMLDADLAVLGGRRMLRLDCDRNLLGGQAVVRLQSTDPLHPRRKPVNILRASGSDADVLMADSGRGETVADVLEGIASLLREAHERRSS